MKRTTISSYVGVRMRAVRTTGARSDTNLVCYLIIIVYLRSCSLDNVLLLEDGSVTN